MGTNTNYFYQDALGNRVFENDKTLVYDGANLFAEIDGDDTTYHLTAGLDNHLLTETPSETYFLLTDIQGSIVHAYTNGASYESMEYSPYGIGKTEYEARHSYTGREFDDLSDTYYYRSRYYAPQSGRFNRVDDVRDGNNWTVYVENDPINYVDPFGFEGERYDLYNDWESGIYLNGNGLSDPQGVSSSLSTSSTEGQLALAGIEIGLGFIPFLGDSIDIYQLLHGENLAGEDLSTSEWVLTGVGVAVPFVGAGVVRRFGSAVKNICKTSKQLENAGGVVRIFYQNTDQIYYRVYHSRPEGSFLTAVPPKSRKWAKEALALPPENKATKIQEVLVPVGTKMKRSRAIPVPEWGRKIGGAEQFELLDMLPPENFGPGVPFK